MNLLPQIKQMLGLQQKADKLPANTRNQLYQAMHRLFGNNMPIGMEDNLESYIKLGYAYNGDVFSIVNYITSTAAGVSWVLKRKKRGGKFEVITDHPIHELMSRPNPHQNNSLFIQSTLGYKLITGNSYNYKVAADKGLKAGIPLQICVLPAHVTEIVGGSMQELISGYRLLFGLLDNIPADKVCHFKYWNPMTANLTDLYGMSPMRAAAKIVVNSNDAFTANSKAFQNMGAVGIISQEVDANQQESILTQEQMNMIKRTWKREETGPENFNKVAFTSASIKYQQLGLSPVDLAILASLKLSFQQLCRVWRFPSVLLNDNENSTYNNVREARKALFTQVIMPELYNLQEGWHNFIVKPFGEDLVYMPDTADIEELQENKKEQVEWLGSALLHL